MNIIQSIKTCFQKYADFSGRASRSEFWWFMLFTAILFFTFELADFKVFSFFPAGDYTQTFGTTLLGLLGLTNGLFSTVSQVGLLIPTLAVTSRRLHDINMSGWWQLLTYLIMFIDLPFGQVPAYGLLFFLPTLIMVLVYLAFVVLWARKGSSGINRFGTPTDHEETMGVFD